MKKLRKLSEKPIIGPVVKKLMDFLVNREVSSIAKHFSTYLEPVVAISPEKKTEVFTIRHNVYCEELKFEDENEAKQEMDDFDKFSIHCLIQHKNTERFAGTVRIVRPEKDDEMLPIEKYCLNSITNKELNPSQFPRNQVCEISRLAVPAEFRRRQADKFKGAETGVINTTTYSETELRCFPFIAIGLYLSAASIVILNDIKHTYVMMEPRLARSMRFVGIQFEQIGPVVDYHGMRAPYYINPKLLLKNLSPGFKYMLQGIEEALQDQYGEIEKEAYLAQRIENIIQQYFPKYLDHIKKEFRYV